VIPDSELSHRDKRPDSRSVTDPLRALCRSFAPKRGPSPYFSIPSALFATRDGTNGVAPTLELAQEPTNSCDGSAQDEGVDAFWDFAYGDYRDGFEGFCVDDGERAGAGIRYVDAGAVWREGDPFWDGTGGGSV